MIRYLLTSILIIIVFMMMITIDAYLLKALYLVNSLGNYAVVVINGARGLLGIP